MNGRQAGKGEEFTDMKLLERNKMLFWRRIKGMENGSIRCWMNGYKESRLSMTETSRHIIIFVVNQSLQTQVICLDCWLNLASSARFELNPDGFI